MPDAAESPWWHRFFDETYADFGLAVKDEARLEIVVDFLLRVLEVGPGDVLFDQCCGTGRLALPMAARGVRVIGVDQVPEYVERATRATRKRDLPAEFHCADAFEFTASRPCDAGVNWFTSFGYQADDDVNVRMLERAFASLRPGGRFALDFQNVPRILGMFQPRLFDPPDPGDGLVVLVESRPDFARGMIDSTWIFVHPNGRRVRREVATRLYMPHELVGLFERAGFTDVALHGSIEGDDFDLRSPRCIVVGRRPEA